MTWLDLAFVLFTGFACGFWYRAGYWRGRAAELRRWRRNGSDE